MEDFEKELKLDFLEEATQLLENTEQAFLQIENDLHNKELIDEIFRFAHNLKGTSRAVGFGVVAEFTHEVENLILKIKQDELEINEHVVSVLLECNDHINMMISELKDNFDATFDSVDLVKKIGLALSGEFISEEISSENSNEIIDVLKDELESFESDLEPVLNNNAIKEDPISDELSEKIAHYQADEDLINQELLKELQQVEDSSPEKQEVSVPSVEFNGELPEKVSNATVLPLDTKKGNLNIFEGKENITHKKESKKSDGDKKPDVDESIRVSLSRVEKLNNFVGELVILQSVLDQQKYIGIKDELAIKSIGQLSKLCKEIQDISMSLRMVPVKTTLQKMSRIVRDTSKTLNKKVNLTLKGEETEIDKTVLEHLADPLVHIVRNAVDHGLEATEERGTVGKAEKGEILIHAYHEGNNLVIDVKDDGKGIDPNIIKKKAIEKGVLSENSNMPDNEIIQLIFHPGFSTKEEVSEVSGRGVGMDVVKTNIEKLSGDVRVMTKLGEGSTFKIVLPLTMAIIDGMIVKVGQDKFVVPIAQVQESLKPNLSDIHYATGLGHCLNLRGQILPVKKISHLLKIKEQEDKLENQIVIIAKGKSGLTAVAVDDIIQQQQVVIKKLGSEIKDQKGFMGSSILGDGKPAFIIDIDDLCTQNKNTKNRLKKVA